VETRAPQEAEVNEPDTNENRLRLVAVAVAVGVVVGVAVGVVVGVGVGVGVAVVVGVAVGVGVAVVVGVGVAVGMSWLSIAVVAYILLSGVFFAVLWAREEGELDLRTVFGFLLIGWAFGVVVPFWCLGKLGKIVVWRRKK
jgi:hypothetical protein